MSTLRQKIAAKKISEILGNYKPDDKVDLGKILREAGFSVSTSKTPKNVTESKGFQKMLDKLLPDKDTLKVHKEILQAGDIGVISFPKNMTNSEIRKLIGELPGFKLLTIKSINDKKGIVNYKNAYYFSPHITGRTKGLDLAYKLKGRYAPEKVKIIDPLDDLTDKQLDERIKEREKELNLVKNGRRTKKTKKAKTAQAGK
jgi:hypothetical protein